MKTLSNYISEGLGIEDNLPTKPIGTGEEEVKETLDENGNVIETKEEDKEVDENGNVIETKEGDDKEKVDESLVNEGVADLLSDLSTEQLEVLMGTIAAVGLVLTAKTYEKISDKLEKSNNPIAKKLVAKINDWGKAAAGSSK